MKKLLITAMTFFSLVGFAGTESYLATITNSMDRDIIKISLDHDTDGKITGLVQRNYRNGSLVKEETFPAGPINEDGILLYEVKQRNVLTLKGTNIDLYQGGMVDLVYLYNGARGTTRSYNFSLEEVDGEWAFYCHGKKVAKMHIVARKAPLVGVIGIKTITLYNDHGTIIRN